MQAVLLIDFGSTYTKITAVDLEDEKLLGTASAYTTVQTDIGEGLSLAMELLERQTGPLHIENRYACSSAAGGLRMLASGLVPELTAEAARLAALGAGAKVLKTYSYQLVEEDIEEIDSLKPDILLLTGGTDGGNRDCILHNARMLAETQKQFPVIVAGNRTCTGECVKLLGDRAMACENVMPKLGTLNIDPAQSRIRNLFLERIIQAKGLSAATELVSGILMPTPAAMLEAMILLADGCDGEPGIGELTAVDLGGATTDVYSITEGLPTLPNTVLKGLPEPYAKRTVEGDIGMRYSIHGIVEAAGTHIVATLAGLNETRVTELVDHLSQQTDTLPDTDELRRLDFALAGCALRIAMTRHAGTVEEVYTPMGLSYMQVGKDLSDVKTVVATGGALIHTENPYDILRQTLASPDQPMSLRPKKARILVDQNYILSAMGLLGKYYPKTALRLMKKELRLHGTTQ